MLTEHNPAYYAQQTPQEQALGEGLFNDSQFTIGKLFVMSIAAAVTSAFILKQIKHRF